MSAPTTALVQDRAAIDTMDRQVTVAPPAPQDESETASPSTSSDAGNYAIDTEARQRDQALPAPRPKILRTEALTFQRLEQRDGVIVGVDSDAGTFTARLVDPRAVEPDQEVEVDLEQVSPGDLELVEPGALFFWAIGYVTRPTGRRSLLLTIDFRRLPNAREATINRAKDEATGYVKEMGWS